MMAVCGQSYMDGSNLGHVSRSSTHAVDLFIMY